MRDRFPAEEYGRHLVEEVRSQRMSRRDLIRRAGVFGLGVPALGLLLDACDSGSAAKSKAAAPPPQQIRRGGTLWVGAVQPKAAIDPVTMYDAGSISVVQAVAEYLIWVNQDYTLRPALATRWTPNADASVWTFQIRQGVRFSDGTPLTADDVVASIERLVAPSSRSSALNNFNGILAPGGTTSTGPNEVTFHLSRPYVDFPYTVASTNYNTVILPKTYGGDFTKHPVGTGPFILTSYKDGAAASFVRNTAYWQPGLPYLDRVEVRFSPEISGALVGVLGGTVDLVRGTPAVDSPLWTDSDVTLQSVPSSYYDQLFFRTDQAPFNDKRVRQAIAYSLQRDDVIRKLFGGRAQLGNDEVFAPGFPHSPSLPQRSYNPEKARALLGAAGLSGGFTATLTTANSGWIPRYAELVQAAAKDIGITIKLNVEDQSAFYGSGSQQPWLDVPLGIVDWAGRATAEQFYGSSFLTGGAWNSAHWSAPEFDTLAAQYQATVDEHSRAGLAQQLATIQQEETPAVVAYWVNSTVVTRKNIRGVSPSGSDFVDLSSAWLS